jgi:methionine-rich copper-binding protein CopC
MRPRIGSARVRTSLIAIVVAALALPGQVAGHAEVVTASPAAGATVTEPVSEVSATYSEGLTPDSRLAVLDQDGVRIAVGRVDPANDKRMVATLDQAYVAGTFTVRSTAIADDGHIERTTWTFTIAVPATPMPTPVCTDQCAGQPSETPAPTPSSTPVPTPNPTPTPSPAPGSASGTGTDVVLPILAGLAIVAVGGSFLLARGRRSGPSE